MEFWEGLDTALQAALIGAGSTIIVAFLGFSGLIFQMHSQGRQNRDSISENERRKIKANLYEEAVTVCRKVCDDSIDLSTKLRMMCSDLMAASTSQSRGDKFPTPEARFQQLSRMHSAFTDSVLRLIFLIENRRFVDPRLIIFRTAFSVVLHETADAMHNKFVTQVMRNLPVDNPEGGIFPYSLPQPAEIENIVRLSSHLINSLDDALCYTDDLLIELQNKLLGDLFKQKLPIRAPIDPDAKVITLDSAEELERWFRTSTPWGKSIIQIESNTRKRFGS